MGTERDVEYENSPSFHDPPTLKHSQCPQDTDLPVAVAGLEALGSTPKELARVRAFSLRGNSLKRKIML